MCRSSQRLRILVVCLVLCLGFVPSSISAQSATQSQGSEPRRLALLIGNSSYQKNGLQNPVNDALDFGVLLEEAGFQTIVKTNLGLRDLENTVRDFSSGLNEGDTALVFYAGHGVESNGVNYLIPVDNATLESEGELKYKAYAATRILEESASRQAGLVILILDACRDNPFPSRSGAGSRGLTVMAAPPSLESVILYSTSPGTVAADGSGRNSVFMRSLLAEMQTPDLSVRDVFDRVGGAVRAATNGSQVPWLNSTPLSKPFVFFTGEAAEARVASLSIAAKSELNAQLAKIADLETARAKAKDDAARQKLDTELATARAIESLKRLESERLVFESARLAEERKKSEAAAIARKNLETSEAAKIAEMKDEATKLRKEYESLVRVDDSAPEFIRQISALEKALKEIGDRYAAIRKDGEKGIQAVYEHKAEALNASLVIEPWENDREFQERTKGSYAALEGQKNIEISTYAKSIAQEQTIQERELKDKLTNVSSQFYSTVYTQAGSSLALSVGEFDRDMKQWSIEVTSLASDFNFKATVEYSIALASDISTAYRTFDTALKSGALAAEVEYSYDRSSESEYVSALSKTLRIRNLTTKESLVYRQIIRPLFFMSWSSPGERLGFAKLRLTGVLDGSSYVINDSPYSRITDEVEMIPGSFTIVVIAPKYEPWRFSGNLSPGQSMTLTVLQKKASLVEMKEVQGGIFSMGSNSGNADEKPVHNVTLTTFMIGKYEITQAQYQKVMGENPSRFNNVSDSSNRPVEQVSWFEAISFCNRLSEMEGLQKVYTINGNNVRANFSKNGFRLPTEAEWEYAARGGSLSKDYIYAGSSDVYSVSWCIDNSGGITHIVGSKNPNEIGLYDMSGNVSEWCWDWYVSYSILNQKDPTGALINDIRVYRGGSWNNIADYLRSSIRYAVRPKSVYNSIGFRVVRRP